jgi:hypothetical protein
MLRVQRQGAARFFDLMDCQEIDDMGQYNLTPDPTNPDDAKQVLDFFLLWRGKTSDQLPDWIKTHII